jgi:hypothetical protein
MKWKYIRIKGISMLPTLVPGDLIRGRYVHATSIADGNIIGYRLPDGRTIVHRVQRVIRTMEETVLAATSGDYSGADPPVLLSGRVIRVHSVLRNGKWHVPRNLAFLYTLCRLVPGRLLHRVMHLYYDAMRWRSFSMRKFKEGRS